MKNAHTKRQHDKDPAKPELNVFSVRSSRAAMRPGFKNNVHGFVPLIYETPARCRIKKPGLPKDGAGSAPLGWGGASRLAVTPPDFLVSANAVDDTDNVNLREPRAKEETTVRNFYSNIKPPARPVQQGRQKGQSGSAGAARGGATCGNCQPGMQGGP